MIRTLAMGQLSDTILLLEWKRLNVRIGLSFEALVCEAALTRKKNEIIEIKTFTYSYDYELI